MEDGLIQNVRRAYTNWKMTSPKMEDTIPKIEENLNQNRLRPKIKGEELSYGD